MRGGNSVFTPGDLVLNPRFGFHAAAFMLRLSCRISMYD
jgi:hypothetical protein